MIISVSLLAANPAFLGEGIKIIEDAGANWVHLDIMDGHYVPNLTWGPQTIKALRPLTTLPFDVHLMIKNPQVSLYIESQAQRITLHPDSFDQEQDFLEALESIEKNHLVPGIAVSPADPFLSWPPHWWPLCRSVTLMSVVPGKGGQPFLSDTWQRLVCLRKNLEALHPDRHIPIFLDGGITPEIFSHAPLSRAIIRKEEPQKEKSPLTEVKNGPTSSFSNKKIEGVVAGSFVLSSKKYSPKEAVRQLREAVQAFHIPVF